jgi:hypothetical protein
MNFKRMWLSSQRKKIVGVELMELKYGKRREVGEKERTEIKNV